MPKASPETLVYVDDFSEGLRTDLPADKAPAGSLVLANNIRLIPKGGWHSRKGNDEIEDWAFGTGKPIYAMEKMVEHDILFVQTGTKIFHCSEEEETPYDIAVTLTDAFRGDFKEYNSQMKFTNGKDPYLDITVGLVKTQFTQASVQIILDEGHADLFFGNSTITADSVDVTNDKVKKVAHGLVNGDKIYFHSSGTIPGGIVAGTAYYVINKTADDFEISLTSGGAKENITSEGVPNLYFAKSIDKVFTADSTTDTLTTTGHGLVNGDRIIVMNSGGALPTGLSASTVYYVVQKTTDTFKLSATYNGGVIDITANGSGTNTWTKGILHCKGNMIRYNCKVSDTFAEMSIPTATYEVGSVVTQLEFPNRAPKGTVLESVFEKMHVSGLFTAGHVIHYSETALATSPNLIDDFTGAGADSELFGKFGTVTAMETLINKMYVAKEKGLEAWTGIDADGIPIREPFDDAYGVVNKDCLVRFGNKLALLTDTNRVKAIQPDTTGVNPEPVINPFFDAKIKGTLNLLANDQSTARMGYNEKDELLRVTAKEDETGVKKTLILHADFGGWTVDTGVNPNCWVEWRGNMYYGDSSVAKVYKSETGFQDGSGNPAIDVLTPVHVVGTYRNKTRVGHIAIKGVILPQTEMTVEIYVNGGKLIRTVTIEGTASYVDQTQARPFGREYFGIDPFGFSGGEDPEAGFNYAVAIDVNYDCRDIQIRFKHQRTGARVQLDYYEIVAADAKQSTTTQLIHI